MAVWLGTDGALSFREAIPSPVNPTPAGTAAICDLDGDGWSEIAVRAASTPSRQEPTRRTIAGHLRETFNAHRRRTCHPGLPDLPEPASASGPWKRA